MFSASQYTNEVFLTTLSLNLYVVLKVHPNGFRVTDDCLMHGSMFYMHFLTINNLISSIFPLVILVPRNRAPLGQHQESCVISGVVQHQ